MSNATLAQPGVLTDPTNFAEYLTLGLRDDAKADAIEAAMSLIANVEKSIRQKDTTAGLSVTTGFSVRGWKTIFPDDPMPAELHEFKALKDGDRTFPSTPGDIFFMIKSSRIDLNFQVAKFLLEAFAPVAEVIEDLQGYKYLDDRDIIDFVDGTENPLNIEREQSVLSTEDGLVGGSYLIVQRYTHRTAKWEALSADEQADVIGRTKHDDLELADDVKPPTAHNAKSKVKVDGEEVKMYRQNRAWGNGENHGTMFVGFAAKASVIETSLSQMITADEDGYFDHLLNFVDAVTGTNYFVPPQAFMDRFS